MNKKFISMVGTLVFLSVASFSVFSEAKKETKAQKERAYGWQLMTLKERAAHRAKITSLKTAKERQAYRNQHHLKMQARAKQQGKELPEKPMERGKGQMRGN